MEPSYRGTLEERKLPRWSWLGARVVCRLGFHAAPERHDERFRSSILVSTPIYERHAIRLPAHGWEKTAPGFFASTEPHRAVEDVRVVFRCPRCGAVLARHGFVLFDDPLLNERVAIASSAGIVGLDEVDAMTPLHFWGLSMYAYEEARWLVRGAHRGPFP